MVVVSSQYMYGVPPLALVFPLTIHDYPHFVFLLFLFFPPSIYLQFS